MSLKCCNFNNILIKGSCLCTFLHESGLMLVAANPASGSKLQTVRKRKLHKVASLPLLHSYYVLAPVNADSINITSVKLSDFTQLFPGGKGPLF